MDAGQGSGSSVEGLALLQIRPSAFAGKINRPLGAGRTLWSGRRLLAEIGKTDRRSGSGESDHVGGAGSAPSSQGAVYESRG